LTDEAIVIEELQVLYLEQLQGPSYDHETLLLLRSIVTFLDITRRLDKVNFRHNAQKTDITAYCYLLCIYININADVYVYKSSAAAMACHR